MNHMLNLVLQIFYRLSLSMETDDQYFNLAFYSKLVYDNWIFDMAKLIDLAAVYGKSNKDTVMKIVSNVFDNEKRYVQDFKESIDLLVSLLKTKFKEYQKVQAMIKGDYINQIGFEEQKAIILNYLNDYVEILSNITLIVTHFPDFVLELMRGTNALIYLANTYCLTLQLKKDII